MKGALLKSAAAAGLLMLLLFGRSAFSEKDEAPVPVLWQDPGDISARNLYYGPEGKEGMPQGPFVFEEEDLDGTNPKFDVTDSRGRSWTVKLGIEAQPETAAVRLVWAVGYFVRPNYFIPRLEVQNMPQRLERGQHMIAPDGAIYGARLKLNAKKQGIWKWKENPFVGTREFNGLRIMMSLLCNLDLKDSNNGIYRITAPDDSGESWDVYLISDLGCSFSERLWPYEMKGNLRSFSRVGFIKEIGPETVDFHLRVGPATVDLAHLIWHSKHRKQHWISKDIPKEDAKWLGRMLGQLSEEQIKDAFRAAGYGAETTQGFTDIIRKKIADLNAL
ncbi:MAG: hypothetical protein GXX84_00865, partial [Acidobacteria bacterium]|nr:hypothetical protein [Acidobacteriota bacterium]